MNAQNNPKFSFENIAEMVISPLIRTEEVATRIGHEWTSKSEKATLKQCLEQVADEYAQTIQNEIAFTPERKLLAVVVELKLRIQVKADEGAAPIAQP